MRLLCIHSIFGDNPHPYGTPIENRVYHSVNEIECEEGEFWILEEFPQIGSGLWVYSKKYFIALGDEEPDMEEELHESCKGLREFKPVYTPCR